MDPYLKRIVERFGDGPESLVRGDLAGAPGFPQPQQPIAANFPIPEPNGLSPSQRGKAAEIASLSTPLVISFPTPSQGQMDIAWKSYPPSAFRLSFYFPLCWGISILNPFHLCSGLPLECRVQHMAKVQVTQVHQRGTSFSPLVGIRQERLLGNFTLCPLGHDKNTATALMPIFFEILMTYQLLPWKLPQLLHSRYNEPFAGSKSAKGSLTTE